MIEGREHADGHKEKKKQPMNFKFKVTLVALLLSVIIVVTSLVSVELRKHNKSYEDRKNKLVKIQKFLKDTGLEKSFIESTMLKDCELIGVEYDGHNFPTPVNIVKSSSIRSEFAGSYFYCLPNGQLFLIEDRGKNGKTNLQFREFTMRGIRGAFFSPFLITIKNRKIIVRNKEELAKLFIANGTEYQMIELVVENFWEKAKKYEINVN